MNRIEWNLTELNWLDRIGSLCSGLGGTRLG